MKVNGIDVKNYMARQCQVVKGYCSISNSSKWPSKSLHPVLNDNEIGMKPLKIVLSVRGNGREEIQRNISNFLSLLREPVEIELDGFNNRFYGILKKHESAESSKRRWHTLTLQFEGYEHGTERETYTTEKEFVIYNDGNLKTPCTVEITPQNSLSEIKVSGAGKDFYIRNLSVGQTVIVDGQTGLMTEEGRNKFPDMDILELPYLLPGENTITVSELVDLKIKHKPMYM